MSLGASSPRPAPARVAFLAPYWSFFETNVAGDLRADRLALAERLAASLEPIECRVALLDDERAGELAAAQARRDDAEALLVMISMCAPPSHALAAIDALPDLPLVIAAVLAPPAADAGLDHARIVTDGATVGTPQLTSVLHRRRRPYELVVVALEDPALPARLTAALGPVAARPRAPRAGAAGSAGATAPPAAEGRAAAAVRSLREARIARVGRPIPGYECVECDADRLRAATGIVLLDVEPASVRDAYLAADEERAAEIEREAAADFELSPQLREDDCLPRAARFAAALEELDLRLGVDAGAMNCHVAELRLAAAEPGFAPCFALGRETTRGVPWSCAGDALAAVAMLTSKLLGGAALYHEIEALDRATDEALLANSGEHDLAFAARGARPLLRSNTWWEGGERCSACACFGPQPGPATLIAFVVHGEEPSGFRFVAAEGSFGGRDLSEAGTPYAAFRFAGEEPVERAWAEWIGSGVNHHSVATPGHLAADVAAVARELGVGCAVVGETEPRSVLKSSPETLPTG